MKSVEIPPNLEKASLQLFDNPLNKEFVTLEQLAGFLGYSEVWIKQQMALGNLPYRSVGRDRVLFYIPEVKQAILAESLAPIQKRKVHHDPNQKKQSRHFLPGENEIEGFHSIQELRKLP